MRKKLVGQSILLSLLVVLSATAFAKRRRAPRLKSGKFLVRLKMKDAGRLPVESVGRLLGGVVESRSAEDPRVFVIEKESVPSIQKTVDELLGNPVVESARPYYVTESVPGPARSRGI